MSSRLGITMGDYNGIGPEIIEKALKRLNLPKDRVLIFGNSDFFSQGFDYEVLEIEHGIYSPSSETKEAGEFSWQCLVKASDAVKKGEISAIVTAPVSKRALHLAGHYYSGQTEVLEKELAKEGQKAEMLFVSGDFRVLLLTRHVALSEVKITKELLIEKIERLNDALQKTFKIKTPKMALCSLNPHAGEEGAFGCEEKDEFMPAVKYLNSKGILISSPVPSDALFVKAAKAKNSNLPQPYDCYAACYHDQGLIPMKMLSFESAVNMTIGLDVIRTSPAHGTAYDIAGKGTADESSMICAIKETLSLL